MSSCSVARNLVLARFAMALLVGAAGCTACTRNAAGNGAGSTPRVGRLGVGKPTYTNTGNATLLTDGAYRGANAWALSGCSAQRPCWAAVQVGSGPSRLLLDWSHEDGDGNITTTSFGGTTVEDYAIAVSSDSTNGANGTWTTAQDALTHAPVAVTGNVFTHRSHVIDFTGASWVKITITAASARSIDELDLWDASSGTEDTYFFHGDSITTRCANLRGTNPNYGEQPSFQAAVQAAHATRYPLQTGGGTVSEGAAGAVTDLATYLPAFKHIKYWFLTMGTNDLCGGAATFVGHAQKWIDAVKAAGHTPILVHPIWGNDVASYCSANGPAFNAAIDRLVATNTLAPPVLLYEATVGHPEYFGSGDVHPNAGGCHAWNRTFATYAGSLGK